MSDDSASAMISSVEIIEKTGISRATLNNYIKSGILPKPVVMKASDPTRRARKVGYFPLSVLDTMALVRLHKENGYTMDSIVRLIHGADSTEKPAGDSRSSVTAGVTTRIQEKLFGDDEPKQDDRITSGDRERPMQLRVTIRDLRCPAYLLNNKCEIDWINEEAELEIFHRNIRSLRDAEQRNIFRLIFNLGMQSSELAAFHMRFFKSRNARTTIRKLYDGIAPGDGKALEKLYDRIPPASTESVQDYYINAAGTRDAAKPYHLYTIIFREGILFLYGLVNSVNKSIAEMLSSRSRIVDEILKQRMPTLTSFAVIVADLQDSTRICAELPPEEYFELINQIWKCMETIFRDYSGTYGKHTGDGMVYYFLKERDANYIMNSLCCALDLREKIRKLSMEWKLRKGWFHDLAMNIGINEGQEYFGTIPASPTMEFTALGDSVNYAGRLSDFARGGAIWTSKNLMNRLDKEERGLLRYGIRKGDAIMDNLFSRVMDLFSHDDPKSHKFTDIATMPVTEIFARTIRENA